MGGWLLSLAVTGGLVWLALRWFAAASPRDLAQGARTFVAVFSALASTGLLLTGRLGLAVVTVAATVMAVRAMRAGSRGADPLGPEGPDVSRVETTLLRMRLDRRSGGVEGEVRGGRFQGRSLASLGEPDLVELLREAERRDPPSVALIEAYLDRRYPDWREAATTSPGRGTPDAGEMDDATARAVLGVARDAGPDEIRAAHRRLMAGVHPDRGGSDFLASQLNRAKDTLLRKRTPG